MAFAFKYRAGLVKRWIFSSLLVILLIPTLFISWLLTTENGLHQLYKLSAGYIPEELQLISLSGKLIGPIRIEKILYRDDKQAIEISRLDLDWDPWALLAGTVDIKQLTIESVALSLAATKKGGDKSTPLQLPEIQLPLQLKLGNMTLAQLQIHQGESVQEISNITVDSEILFDQIAINRLELETREVTLNLQGNIYPAENYNHDLQLTWKTSLLAATETRGRGDVRGDLSATQITQQISGALELKLSLQISDYLDQLKWRTRIDVSSFDTAILAPSSPKISGSLLLNASGDLNIARVNGEIRAKTDMLGPVTGNFKVEKGLTPALINEISIETLNLVSEHGKLAASGLVDWSKGINWQIKANTTALDPALMLPQWPGNINARFTSSGNLRDQQLSVTADIKQLNGQLRGYPVSMSGGLGWHDEILEMSDIKFNSGNTKIVGNGQLGDTLDLQWSIESENLAELYPDGQGKLRASGKLGGTRDKPLISARFIGEALQVPGYRVERVDGDATIKLLHYPEILIDPDLLQINLSAEEITFNDKQIQRVNLLADAKGIDADIDYLGSAFKIQLKGKPEADGWRGMLTRADINTTDYGNWTLLDPVETAVSPSAVELETLCLQNQHRTRLCAKVSQLADHWNIDISARDFVLATIKPWLPSELVVDGLADANAELQFHSSPRLSGKVRILLQPGSVEYNLVSNPVKNLRYVVGELTVDAGPSGINTSAKMT
ncbi:MAG: autotransporter translocation and assembly factor TamB, partial [Gammaproteobacteria bacterium]